MMQALLSLVFAALPMITFLWIIWLIDRYDREPIWLVALNFGWGATGAILLSLSVVWGVASGIGAGTETVTIVFSPIFEEAAKAGILFWTARTRHFDNITDGIVYGTAVGFGFAMTENFLYFLRASTPDAWISLVITRTLYTGVLHAMATGVLGASIGITKFTFASLRHPIRGLGLGLAMLIHGTWNYMIVVVDPSVSTIGILFILLSIIIIGLLMQVALFVESRILLRELLDEVRRGTIPALHLNYLPYTSRRKLIGWLPPSIDAHRYIRLTTELAVRKHQLALSTGAPRVSLETVVDTLRGDIHSVLQEDRESSATILY